MARLGIRKTIFISQIIIILRLSTYVLLKHGVYWALAGELLQGRQFGPYIEAGTDVNYRPLFWCILECICEMYFR